jgi:hypothetical protein
MAIRFVVMSIVLWFGMQETPEFMGRTTHKCGRALKRNDERLQRWVLVFLFVQLSFSYLWYLGGFHSERLEVVGGIAMLD